MELQGPYDVQAKHLNDYQIYFLEHYDQYHYYIFTFIIIRVGRTSMIIQTIHSRFIIIDLKIVVV